MMHREMHLHATNYDALLLLIFDVAVVVIVAGIHVFIFSIDHIINEP